MKKIRIKNRYNNLVLLRKPLGPITSALLFELCSLIDLKNIDFFKKQNGLITIGIVFGLSVSNTGPKLALLLLFLHSEHLIVSKVIDIDSLLVKLSKINAAF